MRDSEMLGRERERKKAERKQQKCQTVLNGEELRPSESDINLDFSKMSI